MEIPMILAQFSLVDLMSVKLENRQQPKQYFGHFQLDHGGLN